MRADRLLSIMLLLQVHRRVTTRELARRLEVSERTIHRDMGALSTAGIPVFAERGARGGWGLVEPYQTKLTGLTKAEIQALFLKPAGLLADLGLGQASEAALIKLLAALPSLSRRDAEYVRQRIHVDGTGWYQSVEEVPFLPTLQEALWQEHRLYLSYQRSDETVVERVVDPLGLVAKGRIWYLVAAVEGEIRTYRVSRVQEAQVTGEESVRPKEFDLATYWERASADFIAALPRYPATVHVVSDLVHRIRSTWRYARILHEGPPDAAGWVTLSVQFETEDEACAYVLGLGPQIEVLEPPELREKIVHLAQSILALYPPRRDPSLRSG